MSMPLRNAMLYIQTNDFQNFRRPPCRSRLAPAFAPPRPCFSSSPGSRDNRSTSSTNRAPVHLRIQNQPRRAGLFDRLRIAQLMLIGRRRQRHQYRRLARRRQSRSPCPARPADHQIRLRERRRHVVEERGHLARRLQPAGTSCAISSYAPRRRSDESAEPLAPVLPQRPALLRRAIQRSRSLAATGDQDV